MDMEHILQLLQTQGLRLLSGLAVLAVGFFLAHWIVELMDRGRLLAKMEPTLKGFLDNLTRWLLYIVVVLTAVGVMGIPLASFVTLLASAGVAISLALQGALGNFVGGLFMLVLKPFMAGDYVKVGDIEGTVKIVGVFYTELVTVDNRRVSLPNSSLTNTAIVNYTREGTRRLDVTYSVSYDADMDDVFAALMAVANRGTGVLPDPAPTVHLSECADSGMKYTVRLWCKTADYWDLYFYLMEEGKRALDRAGIQIPYPQVDVHIKEQ